VFERPVDPLLGLSDKFGVVEEISEGHQPIEVIRPALPALASAAEPRAIRAQIGPELFEMAGQASGLNLQLVSQPAARLDRGKRELSERPRGNRRTVSEYRLGGLGCGYGEEGHKHRKTGIHKPYSRF
jgi:hypothetical protein